MIDLVTPASIALATIYLIAYVYMIYLNLQPSQ